ncbi:MAG: Ig-like domain-containing protein, partial [Oscillospiraceae bacterium]|nr:Ig-like domain-containing protein [Oscillospiraceae bacterium]
MNMKKLLAALLAVVMLAAGAVAAISSVAVYVPVTGVTLSTPPGDLHVGDAFQLIATVQPLDATDQRVIWDSSNRAVATVDHLGDVRVHSIGTAVITATTLGGNFTATAAITVVPVELSSIALSHSNETIFPGQFLHLEAIFLPSNVTNRNVTWSSDNPDIAEVDWSGRVRGRAIGDAIITVTAANGMTASMNVTVAPIRVESVEFVLASTVFHVGTIRMIRVEITPFNATNRDITWSSSDTAVATVDDQGRVTAHSLGIATITATIDEQQFSINVDVQPILVADITLLPSDAEIVMDNTRQIHLSFAPHNAENANFVWSTSDSSIATVDSDGLVTAQGVGTAIITASTADGSVEATASITVLPILVQRVAVNPNALEVRHGQTREIRAFVSPPNATDQRLTWSSSDTAVATVDQEGRVTAHAAGTAIITVTA